VEFLMPKQVGNEIGPSKSLIEIGWDSFAKLYPADSCVPLSNTFCWGYFAPPSPAAPEGGGAISLYPPLVTPLIARSS